MPFLVTVIVITWIAAIHIVLYIVIRSISYVHVRLALG